MSKRKKLKCPYRIGAWVKGKGWKFYKNRKLIGWLSTLFPSLYLAKPRIEKVSVARFGDE
jgi:hypothetical protein